MTSDTQPQDEPHTPVHDCPIQGADTPLVRTLNIKTGEHSWACVWCMMAERIMGEQE